MKTKHKISQDARDFLASVLWAYPCDDDNRNPFAAASVYECHPDLVDAAERFIDGFRDYLEAVGFDLDRIGYCSRSFGGNVYFSLSGHGVGFLDECTDVGDELQAHLEAYSGRKYRFEGLSLSRHRGGLIDLSFLVRYLPEQRDKVFGNTCKPTPADACRALGCNATADAMEAFARNLNA